MLTSCAKAPQKRQVIQGLYERAVYMWIADRCFFEDSNTLSEIEIALSDNSISWSQSPHDAYRRVGMFSSLRTRCAPVLQSLRKTHTGHVDRRSLPLRDGHVHTGVELAPNVNFLPWSEAPRSVYRHAEVFQKILMACWNYEAVCLPPRMALTDPHPLRASFRCGGRGRRPATWRAR